MQLFCTRILRLMSGRNSLSIALMSLAILPVLHFFLELQDARALPHGAISISQENTNNKTLDDSQIKNFRYHLSFVKGFVELKDGFYNAGSNPDDFITARLEHYAIGDMDSDGNDDAAIILSSHGMGSGTFYELTALLAGNGAISQTNSIVIGDRIRVESLSIEQGRITLDVLAHKPDDPSCCPSQKYLRQFDLVGKRLVETNK